MKLIITILGLTTAVASLAQSRGYNDKLDYIDVDGVIYAVCPDGVAFAGVTDAVVDLHIPERITVNDDVYNVCAYTMSRDAGVYNYTLKYLDTGHLTSVNDLTFKDYKSLETAHLPNVTYIGSGALEGCTSLMHIDAPKVEHLSSSAMAWCTSLKEITLPNLNSISRTCFEHCSSIEKFVFEAPKIHYYVDLRVLDSVEIFTGCASLHELVVKGRLTSPCYHDEEFTGLPSALPFSIYDGLYVDMLRGCDSIEKIYINFDLFYNRNLIKGNANLKSLTIGNNCISYMMRDAFTGGNIQDIHCMFPIPPIFADLEGEPIEVDKSDCVVYVPRGCRDRYNMSPYWSQFANIVEDQSVEPLFDPHSGPVEPIAGIDGAEYCYFPTDNDGELAAAMAWYQFKGMDEDVPVFYNYPSANKYYFYQKPSRLEFNVPSTVTADNREYVVTEIAPYTAYGYRYVSSINVTEGIKRIGDYAFSDTRFIEYATHETYGGPVYLPSTLLSIGRKVLENVDYIVTINCKAMTPPELADDRFCTNSEVRSHIELNVPPEAAEAYRSTPVWRDFIINGVQSVETVAAEVAEGDAEYYNLQGMRVTPDRAGVYIRRAGGEVTKVVVRR